MNTPSAIVACRAAHERLLATASGVDDETARRPSKLPGWSVGHVLTHLARNAEGHVGRLEGALRGEGVARYPGGDEQRDADIERGAGRSAAELSADMATWSHRLEATWGRCEEAGWPHADLLAGDEWPTPASPLRRLREVEVHHVDLGLGYAIGAWPDDYVSWELATTLERLPDRLSRPNDPRRLLAWPIGRAPQPDGLELGPW